MGLLESFFVALAKVGGGAWRCSQQSCKTSVESRNSVGNDGAEFNSKQRGLEVVNWWADETDQATLRSGQWSTVSGLKRLTFPGMSSRYQRIA